MKSSALKIALALATCALAFPASAQTKPGTPAEAERQFQAADADLNRLWQRCVDPEERTVQSIAALRKAQQAWGAVRDQTARAYQQAESDRRPLDDEYYTHGRTVMTLSRIEELKTLFECK